MQQPKFHKQQLLLKLKKITIITITITISITITIIIIIIIIIMKNVMGKVREWERRGARQWEMGGFVIIIIIKIKKIK